MLHLSKRRSCLDNRDHLTSQRTVVVLGAIVLAGLVVAYAFYSEAFISVWCFFAAAASVAILCHFEWLRRSSLRTAGP
jgi:hypothetical protein